MLGVIALPVSAANYRTEVWISITNTPVNGDALTWNSTSTRTWADTVTNSTTQIQTTNSIEQSRTNLYAQLAANKFALNYDVAYGTNTNDVIVYAPTNAPLTITLGGNWASVRTYMNPIYGSMQVWAPFPTGMSNAMRQYIASELLTILQDYATNAVSPTASWLANVVTKRTDGQSTTNLNLKNGFTDGTAISNAPVVHVTLLVANSGTLSNVALTNITSFNLSGGTMLSSVLSNVMVYASNMVAKGGYFTNVSLDRVFGTNVTLSGATITGSVFTVTGNGIGTWVTVQSSSSTASLGPAIWFTREHGSGTKVNAGDVLGHLLFAGLGDTAQKAGARIKGIASQQFSDTNSPAYIVIETTPAGSAATVGRVWIDYDTTMVTNDLRVAGLIRDAEFSGIATNLGAMVRAPGVVTNLVAGMNTLVRRTNEIVRLGAGTNGIVIGGVENAFGDGDSFIVINDTGYSVLFTNESGLITAATNRLRIPNGASGVVLPKDGMAMLTRLDAVQRWNVAVLGIEDLNLPGLVPVGGIVAWAKSLTNTAPALSTYFVECNGQTLSDTNSVFHGLVIPDLNGGNRFLRGSSTSGSTGGAESHDHAFNTSQTVQSGGDFTVADNAGGTTTESHLPPYYNVVWVMRVK